MKRVTTGDSVFGSSNPLRGSPWLEKGAARVRTLKAGRRTDSGWGGGSVPLCPYSGGRRRRGWMGLLGRACGSARAREYRRMAAGSGQRAAGSVVAREGPGPDGTGFAWLRRGRARSFVSRLSGSVVQWSTSPRSRGNSASHRVHPFINLQADWGPGRVSSGVGGGMVYPCLDLTRWRHGEVGKQERRQSLAQQWTRKRSRAVPVDA